MWSFFIDGAKWAWSERAFLKPLYEKYRDLPGGVPKFDGPKLKALIVEYEPIVFQIVTGGLTLTGAVFKIIATKLAPHKMTPAEERKWMDDTVRPSGH